MRKLDACACEVAVAGLKSRVSGRRAIFHLVAPASSSPNITLMPQPGHDCRGGGLMKRRDLMQVTLSGHRVMAPKSPIQ